MVRRDGLGFECGETTTSCVTMGCDRPFLCLSVRICKTGLPLTGREGYLWDGANLSTWDSAWLCKPQSAASLASAPGTPSVSPLDGEPSRRIHVHKSIGEGFRLY